MRERKDRDREKEREMVEKGARCKGKNKMGREIGREAARVAI